MFIIDQKIYVQEIKYNKLRVCSFNINIMKNKKIKTTKQIKNIKEKEVEKPTTNWDVFYL